VQDLIDGRIARVSPDCDVTEALRLLLGEHTHPMLLVVSDEDQMQGIVTKTDILHALKTRHETPAAMKLEKSVAV
jgi:predicted transcriptional regulator